MKRKIYYTKCKKFKKSKISFIWYKRSLLSSICNKCDSEDEGIIVEGEPIEILKICGLINNIDKYQKIPNHA